MPPPADRQFRQVNAAPSGQTYITATLMPSIVRDIGGLSLFAWATTIYVAASVLGSTFVAVRPERVTLNHCYRAGCCLTENTGKPGMAGNKREWPGSGRKLRHLAAAVGSGA